MLVNVARLLTAYYTVKPDAAEPAQRVSFGTSGHRGSSFHASFNEDHILAISQAICEYRTDAGADGPLFLAKDTHALSEPAFATALEVLCGQRRRGRWWIRTWATRRRRRYRTPSSATTAGARRGWRTES